MRSRLLLFLALFAASAFAGSPRDALLVTPAWLAEHLEDPDLVLLHVGENAGYEEKHIPGAQFVMHSDLAVSDPEGLRLEMPPPEDLRQRLRKLGISDRSRVVVYYGKDWISPSTRILFTLDYAGLGESASLLDGGMDAWIAAGHEVTAEVPKATEGTLSPLKIRPLVVGAEFVRANRGRGGVAVIDARDAAFYDGTKTGGSGEKPHRTGHIAGAGSLPFSKIADEALRVLPAGELRSLFASAGAKPGDTIVAYCHIGQQATAVLFAARTLGHRVLLYDGSFEEWSRIADAPVENPAKR